MARGGVRPNAGRKKGGANRLTQEAATRAESTGELPLDFLLRVMRDVQEDQGRRVDCAKAAAPYLHAKRAPVNGEGEDVGLTVIVQKP